MPYLQQTQEGTDDYRVEQTLSAERDRVEAWLRAQEAKIEALRRVRAGKSLRRVAVNGRN